MFPREPAASSTSNVSAPPLLRHFCAFSAQGLSPRRHKPWYLLSLIFSSLLRYRIFSSKIQKGKSNNIFHLTLFFSILFCPSSFLLLFSSSPTKPKYIFYLCIYFIVIFSYVLMPLYSSIHIQPTQSLLRSYARVAN